MIGYLNSAHNGAILTGSLTTPSPSSTLTLTNIGDVNGDFSIPQTTFASAAAMNSTIADGTFTFAGTTTSGSYKASLNLNGNFTSKLVPTLTTFTSAVWSGANLLMSSSAPATINWTSSSIATDKVLLTILNSNKVLIFQTVLPGNQTSFTLPVLPSGSSSSTYYLQLAYLSVSDTNTSSIPGATGYAGYFIENDITISSQSGPVTAPATMITPVNGTQLNTTSPTFLWAAGTNVDSYAMWVGSSPLTYDYYSNYQPATNGNWSNTGSLNAVGITNLDTGEAQHIAVLLPNGKVLAAGGITSGTSGFYPISNAQIYDPVTSAWTRTGSLNQARSSHTATSLLNANGKVLVAGGNGSGGTNSIASAEVYNPSTGSWSPTGSLNNGRADHTATLLSSGKVLVAGGSGSNTTLNTSELYNPVTTTWALTSGTLNNARKYHTATLLANGKVLVVGGAGDNSLLNTAELYDPATDLWTLTGTLNSAREFHTATLLANGKVLVVGGFGNTGALNSAELYDPATGLWTPASALHSVRYLHTATPLSNGKILVAAGLGNNSGALSSAELYDPATGTWSITGSMSNARYIHSATLLSIGKVLFAGGSSGSSTLASAELFDPNTASYNLVGLPSDNRKIYVTLWSVIGGVWYSNQYIYYAMDGRAQLLTPTPGSTLGSSSATFTYTAGTGASQYAMWVGSNPGTYDISAIQRGTNLNNTVNNLPTNAAPLYVRLWTMLSGNWQYNDYIYTAADGKATMVTPVNGSTFGSSTATFTWNAATGATQYALWIGSAPNTYDLYAKIEGTNLTDTVTTIPTDGRVIYVNLWSYINGVWVSNSYSYTAFTGLVGPIKAAMLTPASGSTFASSSATFTWNTGVSVTQYALWVGSTPGAYDLYASLEGGTSRTLTLPTDGRRIYVRLYSMINGVWKYNGYTYNAFSGPDTKAVMTTPVPGTTLSGSTSISTFNWSAGTGVSQYALWVGSNPDTYNLYAASEGANQIDTLTSLPVDGSPLYVNLWSMIGGVWQANKYIYKAVTTGSAPKALITSPANGSLLSSSTLPLTWSAGSSATWYALWVGSSPNSYDIYASVEGTNLSRTVQVPLDGRRLYVTIWSYIAGSWQPAYYYYDTTQ